MSIEELSQGPIRAQDLFVDRVSELQAFDDSVAAVRQATARADRLESLAAAPRRNVLMYYGEFGIGKTSVLRRLQRRFDSGDCRTAAPRRASFLLDIHDERTLDLEATLLDVRAALGRLHDRWYAFDLALAVYWEQQHPGEPLTQFLDRNATLARIARAVGLAEQVQAVVEHLIELPPGVWGTITRVGAAVGGKIRDAVRERRVLRDCTFLEQIIG